MCSRMGMCRTPPLHPPSAPDPRGLNPPPPAIPQADTNLNHNLNNAMAEASGLIELFLETAEKALLPLAQSRLQSGMGWCEQRLLMMKLTATEGVREPRLVTLYDFMGKVACGHDLKSSDAPHQCVLLDEEVCLWNVALCRSGGGMDGARIRGATPGDTGLQLRSLAVPTSSAL